MRKIIKKEQKITKKQMIRKALKKKVNKLLVKRIRYKNVPIPNNKEFTVIWVVMGCTNAENRQLELKYK